MSVQDFISNSCFAGIKPFENKYSPQASLKPWAIGISNIHHISIYKL